MKNNLDGSASLQWRHLYEAAVLELDYRRLPDRIEEARQAILICLQSEPSADGVQTEALTNALQVLEDLLRITARDGNAGAA